MFQIFIATPFVWRWILLSFIFVLWSRIWTISTCTYVHWSNRTHRHVACTTPPSSWSISWTKPRSYLSSYKLRLFLMSLPAQYVGQLFCIWTWPWLHRKIINLLILTFLGCLISLFFVSTFRYFFILTHLGWISEHLRMPLIISEKLSDWIGQEFVEDIEFHVLIKWFKIWKVILINI